MEDSGAQQGNYRYLSKAIIFKFSSFRTDSNGNYIKGYWGFCNSGCAAVPVGSATAVRATRYNSEDGTTIEDDEDTGDIVVDLVEEPAENAP